MFRRYLKSVMSITLTILGMFLIYVKYKTLGCMTTIIFGLIVLLLISFGQFNLENKLFKEIEDDYKNGEISEGAFTKIKKALHEENKKKISNE